MTVLKKVFGTPTSSSLFRQFDPTIDDPMNLASLIAASWNPLIERLKALPRSDKPLILDQ